MHTEKIRSVILNPKYLPTYIFILILLIFTIVSSKTPYGYEVLNIQESDSWITGTKASFHNPSGIMDIAPFYIFTHIKHFLNSYNIGGDIKEVIYAFVNPFLAALICLAFYLLCIHLYMSRFIASVLSFILAFTTIIFPYSKMGLENSQTLWILFSTLTMLKYFERPKFITACYFGASLAALLLTKVSGLFFCVLFGAAALYYSVSGRNYRKKEFYFHSACAFFIFALGFFILVFSNRARYEYGQSLLAGRYNMSVEITVNPIIDTFYAALFSFNKSIFIFSPTVIIGLWYYKSFFKRYPQMIPVFFIMAAAAVYFLVRARFVFEETWGPRRFHYIIPFMILPLGIWIENFIGLHKIQKALSIFVIAAGFAVQLTALPFDCSIMPVLMKDSKQFSLDNVVWHPSVNQIRFNIHLVNSKIDEYRGKQIKNYKIKEGWIYWAAPLPLPEDEQIDIHNNLNFNIWYLQQYNQYGTANYWFINTTSYLFLLIIQLIILFSLLIITIMKDELQIFLSEDY